MIQAIGFMVGFYVITRMFSLLLKNKDGKESIITLVFAGITILVAFYGLYELFTAGVELSNLRF